LILEIKLIGNHSKNMDRMPRVETNTPNTQGHMGKWKKLWKVWKPQPRASPTSKTPPRLNEKKQKDHERKGLCFSYHKLGHQSFQCSKRPHHTIAFSLIVYKEGGKNKNP